jgi:hypothetical protein
LRRVKVKSSAKSEIPSRVIPRVALVARAGIRSNQNNAGLGGKADRAAFGHEMLFGASQAGKIKQTRDLQPFKRLFWQKDGKAHLAADFR